MNSEHDSSLRIYAERVPAAARGDDTFVKFYREFHPLLVRSLLFAAGDQDSALDVAAEAFARALHRWDRVGIMDSPRAWTATVAMNLLRRRLRRRSMERRLLHRTTERVDVPELPDPAVWDAVAVLPLRQREVVVLRYVADLNEREVAEVLGISPGTASAHLARARRTLRTALASRETSDG